MMRDCRPKVSVCVLAYNHEPYIRACLQSLVDQQTSFPFEVVVVEDASSDRTGEIVAEFARAYPDIVKPFFQPSNVGPTANYIFAHEQAAGQYIAHLDGDDYVLPGKLQRQADFLDANEGCAIVWHRMQILDQASNRLVPDLIDVTRLPAEGMARAQLVSLGSVACHSSKMYRAAARPDPYPKAPFLDLVLDVEHMRLGRAVYLPDILGVYRANVGISASGFKTRGILLDNLGMLAARYPELRRAVCCQYLRLFLGDVRHRNPTLRKSLWGCIRTFQPLALADFLVNAKLARMFRSPL